MFFLFILCYNYNGDSMADLLEGLDQERLTILKEQIDRFNKLSTNELKGKEIVKEGKLVLPVGTLIHGTTYYSSELVSSIKKTGLLASKAVKNPEDDERNYCCKCYIVNDDVTQEEYNGSFIYRDGRSPFGNLGKDSLAFIIYPNAKLDSLISYDSWRDTENGRKARLFTDELGIPSEYRDDYANILYGIPSNYINGIVMGDHLIMTDGILDELMKVFPTCFIVRKTGEFIRRVNEDSFVSKLRLEKVRETIKYELATKDLISTKAQLEIHKKRFGILEQGILATCEPRDLLSIYKDLGFQGNDMEILNIIYRMKEKHRNNEEKSTSSSAK